MRDDGGADGIVHESGELDGSVVWAGEVGAGGLTKYSENVGRGGGYAW